VYVLCVFSSDLHILNTKARTTSRGKKKKNVCVGCFLVLVFVVVV